MRSDKERALELRRQGKSYTEISDALGIPKGTLSGWLQRESWSKEIKAELTAVNREEARIRMQKIGQKRSEDFQKLYLQRRKEARKIYKTAKKSPLFIAGLMIYWGEGDSNLKNNFIRVANTDAYMLQIFHNFLKTYFPELLPRVRGYLVLYKDLDDFTCKKYWSPIIGIGLDKFQKSQYIEGRHPTKRLSYGICSITVSSRQHKEMMDEWILLAKHDRQFHAGIV